MQTYVAKTRLVKVTDRHLGGRDAWRHWRPGVSHFGIYHKILGFGKVSWDLGIFRENQSILGFSVIPNQKNIFYGISVCQCLWRSEFPRGGVQSSRAVYLAESFSVADDRTFVDNLVLGRLGNWCGRFSVLIGVLSHLVFTIIAELGNSNIKMILGFSWDF